MELRIKSWIVINVPYNLREEFAAALEEYGLEEFDEQTLELLLETVYKQRHEKNLV